MAKHQRKTQAVCVYCCHRAATTRDHVIPRCLFDGDLPSNMATVPACNRCNTAKSLDDNYLRDMLVIDSENDGHPVAQAIVREKLARAARRNMSQIARDIAKKGKLVPVYSMGGVYLGHQHGVPLDAPRANRIFALMTRGLYYRIYRERLPLDTTFEVRRVDRFRVQLAIQNLRDMGVTTCRRLGTVFGCMHTRAIEDLTVTRWLLWYYKMFFTVTTNLSKHPELGE